MGLNTVSMPASGLETWHDANPKVKICNILPSGTGGGIIVVFIPDPYTPVVDTSSGWDHTRVTLPVNVQGGIGPWENQKPIGVNGQ